MSKNILQLLVDSVWDCGVSACKMLSKAFGLDWNEYDFKKFFNAVNLKNNQGITPSLKKKSKEGVYKIYIFDVPVGLSLNDFKSKISPLSFFMKVNEEDLYFESLDDLSGVRLKVLCFSEFFRLYQLKNSKEKYPELKDKKEEELFDSYIFNIPKGLGIEEFRAKFENFHSYLKIDESNMIFEIIEIKDSCNIEIRVYK